MEERRFLNVCKRPLLPLHFMMRWMWHTIKCLIDVGTIFINIKKGGFASWLLRYSHLFNFQEVHLISSRLTITSTTTIIIVVVLEMICWAKGSMLGYHMWSPERGVGGCERRGQPWPSRGCGSWPTWSWRTCRVLWDPAPTANTWPKRHGDSSTTTTSATSRHRASGPSTTCWSPSSSSRMPSVGPRSSAISTTPKKRPSMGKTKNIDISTYTSRVSSCHFLPLCTQIHILHEDAHQLSRHTCDPSLVVRR